MGVDFRADPNHSHFSDKPLSLAVRARNVAAAKALLEKGAELTRPALDGLRRISSPLLLFEFENMFMAKFEKNKSLTLEDIGLWAAVQCGFTGVATKVIKDND